MSLPRLANAQSTQEEAIDLVCGDTCASVLVMGAELSRWACGKDELLWSGDPSWWARQSPVLFPLVGHLNGGQTRFSGTTYRMPTHGFASSTPFLIVDRTSDRVTLALHSDEHTRAMYPFDFELSVQYQLSSHAIGISLSLRNSGTRPMPYSIGLHPGFRWPWGSSMPEGHVVTFEFDESPHVPLITDRGLFTESTRQIPIENRRLPLTHSLLAREALCFVGARSRSLALEAPDGTAIEATARGFAHWAIWGPPQAPLVCIEAWTGHGDAIEFDGEFEARPSTLKLAPGEVADHGLHLRFRAAGEIA